MSTTEKKPLSLDSPAVLNRMIIEASQYLRQVIDADDSTAKPDRLLKATAEFRSLLELRLTLVGVLQQGPGRPRNKPGRPAAAAERDQDEQHPGIYQVAADLRAALLDLPEEVRGSAYEILGQAFPALLAEPIDPERVRASAPVHLKPALSDTPAWLRQNWRL